ncbi:MAG: cyclic-di-AMP receptor [Chloroflexi bacterium]|nr:cyclic-di-AMP receptor [Chloroflexota bacterium]
MDIDKLILAIVQREDADAAMNVLTQAGLSVTRISSLGGFMGTHNVTLLIGLSSNNVDRAISILRIHCHKRTVPVHMTTPAPASHLSGFMRPIVADVGSAVVFVFPVARYIHLGANQSSVDAKHAFLEPGALQLVLVIVSDNQSGKLLKRLTDWSYHATLISTTGGFLKRGNATLMIGVRSERVDSILEQVHQVTGGTVTKDSAATVFVLEITRQERM